MATIRPVLRGKPDKDGKKLIFIRVSTTDNDAYKSTGQKCIPDHFQNGRVIIDRDRDYINGRISAVEAQLRKTYFAYTIDGQQVEASEITGGKKQVGSDFLVHFQKDIDKISNRGTKRRKQAVLNKLKQFTRTLPLRHITKEWIESYEAHLRAIPNDDGTIRSNLSAIQASFNTMPGSENHNPWKKYKKPKQKPNLKYLERFQVDEIENLKIDPNTQRFIWQQMFVFSCHNGGIRVSDLLMLQWSEIRGERIVWDIMKTVSINSIPLFAKGKEIIEKFKGRSRFVFPILPEDLDLKDDNRVRNLISEYTAIYNSYLKTIAIRAEIDMKVTSHLARHTFATMAIMNGLRIEYVADILGITLGEAQKYGKLIPVEVEKEARRVMDSKK